MLKSMSSTSFLRDWSIMVMMDVFGDEIWKDHHEAE
jgi:hypothetical protein